jgi:OOP family OmpA-OmpF porin
MLTRSIAALALLAVALHALPASAAPFNSKDVVQGETDKIVETKSGDCVRTKWQAGTDPCAPPPPPPPPPVVQAPPPPPPPAPPPPPPPAPRTVINKEDRTVYFAHDSDRLAPEAKARLDQLARTLTAARDIQRAEIVGFADRMGSKSYNYALSAKRARAVEAYLNQRGYINTSVAEVRAVGEEKPTAECAGKLKRETKIACLSPDRKVEVQIIYTTIVPGTR